MQVGQRVKVTVPDSSFFGMTGKIVHIRTAGAGWEPDNFLSISVLFENETCAFLRGKRIKWSPYELGRA